MRLNSLPPIREKRNYPFGSAAVLPDEARLLTSALGRTVPFAENCKLYVRRCRAPAEHLPEVDVLCSLVFERAVPAQNPGVGTGPTAAQSSAGLCSATSRALPARTVAVIGVGPAVVLSISLRLRMPASGPERGFAVHLGSSPGKPADLLERRATEAVAEGF